MTYRLLRYDRYGRGARRLGDYHTYNAAINAAKRVIAAQGRRVIGEWFGRVNDCAGVAYEIRRDE